MKYVIEPVNTVVKARLERLNFDSILRETRHCTYIRSVFPAAQYASDKMILSLYPSGVIMVYGHSDHDKAHKSIDEFVNHLTSSGIKNILSTKSIKNVNTIYNVKPIIAVKMDMEKLKKRGDVVVSFKTEGIKIEQILEDTIAHATVYSNGSISLQVSPHPADMTPVLKWIETLFTECSVEI